MVVHPSAIATPKTKPKNDLTQLHFTSLLPSFNTNSYPEMLTCSRRF
jgi:hypothetical protein